MEYRNQRTVASKKRFLCNPRFFGEVCVIRAFSLGEFFEMKRARECVLERLLRNAAFAAPDAPTDIGFDVQTRILAGWRAGQKEGEVVLGMLRKAVLASAAASSVAIACAVVVIDKERAKPEREIVASVTNNSVVAMEFTWIEREIGRQSGTDPEYP